MTRTLWMVGVLVGVLACGSDDGRGDDANEREPGGTDAGESEGLACGNETCTLPEELEGEEPCCMDRFVGGCGVKAGPTCRPIPMVDERCPRPDIMANFPGASEMKVFGCCTDSNQCGIDFGMGCLPRTIACNVIGPDQVDRVQPQTCDGMPLELPANCGMGGVRIPIPGAGD